jgi:hypothetical protein
MHRVDRAVLPSRLATFGVSLQDQHDDVVGQVSRGDRLVEPLSRACAVTPPAGRSAADDVRAVDDEHAHTASLGEPCTRPRASIFAPDGTIRRYDARCRCTRTRADTLIERVPLDEVHRRQLELDEEWRRVLGRDKDADDGAPGSRPLLETLQAA